MQKLPPRTYLTVEELDALARHCETEAAALPSGDAKSALLREAGRLRICANTNRMLPLATTSDKSKANGALRR